MMPLQKLGINCWSLMENFGMCVLLQLTHFGFWEVEFTRQKSVLRAALSPCVLACQGFVQGFRYHQIGLCYCKNTTQLATTQDSWTLLGPSLCVAISSFYENQGLQADEMCYIRVFPLIHSRKMIPFE